MSYRRQDFPGCCAAEIVYDVDNVTAKELGRLNALWPLTTLFAIVDTNNQTKSIAKFYKAGWKKIGRKWKNSSTGNTLQMIVRYPIKRK